MKKGKKYAIHGYKHNGKIYKIWNEATFIDETEDYYVFGNNNVEVTETYGKSWKTKETAILFYFKEDWFNVIAQLKPTGLYFYCNIATPLVIEEDVIKFIDYDLDLRIYPDGTYKTLDKSEYEYHKKIMKYPEQLDEILKYELAKLKEKYKSKNEIFDETVIKKYSEEYKKIKNL